MEKSTKTAWKNVSVSKKKTRKSSSNIFDNFTNDQVNEFKTCFQFMDFDKDGIISKDDLRLTYESLGKVASERELDNMITSEESGSSIDLTQLLTLFYNRMSLAGEVQDDADTVTNAFKVYEEQDGSIDVSKFRQVLMTGDLKFTEQEVDLVFAEMEIENGRIDAKAVIQMILGVSQETKEVDVKDDA